MTVEFCFITWLTVTSFLISGFAVTLFRDRRSIVKLAYDRNTLVNILISLIVSLPLILLCLLTAKFGFTDDNVFLKFYALGVPYPPPVWKAVGRFFPLGHQEWRLIYLWSSNPLIYYIFDCIEYFLYNFLLFRLLSRMGALSPWSILLLSTIPSVLLSFSALVFPERNILFLIPIFLLSVINWEKTYDKKWFFSAALTAQLMLHMKEPIVFLIQVFSAVFLIYGIIRIRDLRIRLALGKLALHMVLISLCIIWVVEYLLVIKIDALGTGMAYGGATLSFGNTPKAFLSYLKHEPATVLLLGLTLLIPIMKTPRGFPMLVALIVGAWAYWGLMLMLGLRASWYSAIPSVFVSIAVVYTFQNIELSSGLRWIKSGFLLLCIVSNFIVSISVIAYRTDWIIRNESIVNEIRTLKTDEVKIFGGQWDVRMLEDKLHFELPRVKVVHSSGDNCKYSISLLDYSERSGQIICQNNVIWEYRSLFFNRILSHLPAWSHPFFQSNYTIWW